MKKLFNILLTYIKKVYIRFFKFGIVGFIGTIIDFLILFALNSLFKHETNNILIMNLFVCIAFEISCINNYLFSYFWVWKDKKGQFFLKFLKYNLSNVFSFSIRLLVFNIGIYITKADPNKDFIQYYFIFLVSMGVAMLINFILMEHKVFKNKKAESEINLEGVLK